MRLEVSRQIFKQSPNIKFHENPTSESRVVNVDRRTDIKKLIVVYRNFAKAPKNNRQTESLENTNKIQIRNSSNNVHITTYLSNYFTCSQCCEDDSTVYSFYTRPSAWFMCQLTFTVPVQHQDPAYHLAASSVPRQASAQLLVQHTCCGNWVLFVQASSDPVRNVKLRQKRTFC
jgi:hypothetical protein